MTQQITPLPTPPQPSDSPADFDSKAFSLLGALPNFVTQVNNFGVEATAIGEAADADAQAANAAKNAAQISASSASSSASSASTSKDQAATSASAASQSKIDAEGYAASAKSSAESVNTEYLKNRLNHTGSLNWSWAVYGGSANAISLSPIYARASYSVGDQIRFRATTTNTGPSTINVSSLGAKNAVTITGAPLPLGYIRTDVDTVAVYNGSNWVVDRICEFCTNSNGSYTRLANGVQIAYGLRSIGFINASNIGVAWAFPALFTSVPSVTATPELSDSIALVKRYSVNMYSMSASGANITLARTENDWVAGDVSGNNAFHTHAIGRWY